MRETFFRRQEGHQAGLAQVPVLFLEAMPVQLTVPTLQRTRVVPPVYKEEAAAQQAAVQEIPNIPKRNRLAVPSVPCNATAAIKKGETSAARWKDLNRQAARREKAVELPVCENGLKIREGQKE
jgi:hypothetical protein